MSGGGTPALERRIAEVEQGLARLTARVDALEAGPGTPEPEPPPEPPTGPTEPPRPPLPPLPGINPHAPAPPAAPPPEQRPGMSGRTLTVGPGQQFGSVTTALDIAAHGDTIHVTPQTPRESFRLTKNVLLDGTGVSWDFSDLRATQLARSQGAIVVEAQAWVIRGFSITGAGIQETAHTLVSGIRVASSGWGLIDGCRFRRCQNGIGGSSFNWVLEVVDCDVAHCGLGDGLTHNIYVNDGWGFTMRGGRSVECARGHALKSRAFHTTVEGWAFLAQTQGACIDCGSGGLLRVRDATLLKPDGPSGVVISYGAENENAGILDTNSVDRTVLALYRANNTIQQARGGLTFGDDNLWLGNRLRAEGAGTVTGLPG